jgi:hypothetical protein
LVKEQRALLKYIEVPNSDGALLSVSVLFVLFPFVQERKQRTYGVYGFVELTCQIVAFEIYKVQILALREGIGDINQLIVACIESRQMLQFADRFWKRCQIIMSAFENSKSCT